MSTSAHFTVGTKVVADRRAGTVIERDGLGGMSVQWDDGDTSTAYPFALAHEVHP